ncbi:MAG TPA: cyclase family protein [Candidatus Binatia bacterium]|nr:cyclase family protein [Candidatus Binatia bacterium]
MAATNDIDEIGAMKLLTPALVRSAAGLVKQGKIYSLGQVLEPTMPHLPRHPPLVVAPFTTPYQSQRRWEKRGAKNLPGTASERVEINTHSGTHIDALGHWSNCNRSYGELDAKENYTENGLAHLGLERIPPIVARGILIDVAGHAGMEMLEAGRVITIRDIRDVLEAAGLSIRRGDVVLLYTGWSKLWKQRDLRYCESEPGPGRETAAWLADQQIIALGTDTMAVDVDPPEDAAYPRVVHQIMLVERGIHLIENLYLDELVRDKVYEFLFVLATPKLKGGTAFPVEPLAIV